MANKVNSFHASDYLQNGTKVVFFGNLNKVQIFVEMVFKDKVIWITGASSGIGEHLAYALAEQGAKLILSSRNEKELNRVKHNCHTTNEILVLPLDVSDFESLPKKTAQAVAHFGVIHILINNAGVSQRALAADTRFEVDQTIIHVNYLGQVALTKSVLPYMLAQGFGHLVVISSVTGKLGLPYRSAYAASKHALHGYFDALRLELAEVPIPVTIICPGYVHTNVTINALQGDGSRYNRVAATNRQGMDPTLFARKVLRAIAARRREVLIGGRELLAVYAKRFWPWFLYMVLRRMDFSSARRGR
ncbi:MAG TPA: SDR family oxidoreductase [Saprospiraceae bacterium]|nr:SDR family oxidoreductase [Saprospiraceae bacterium]HMP13968.1 SDR family oxidoreductase [Saprospiraceae bacterium]